MTKLLKNNDVFVTYPQGQNQRKTKKYAGRNLVDVQDEKMWVKICITHGKFGFLPSIKMCMVVNRLLAW